MIAKINVYHRWLYYNKKTLQLQKDRLQKLRSLQLLIAVEVTDPRAKPNSGTWDIVANATPWTPWTLPITRTTPATKDVHLTHIASEFNFIMLNIRIKLVTTINVKQKLGILQVRGWLSKEVGTLPEGDSWNSGLRWCWKDYWIQRPTNQTFLTINRCCDQGRAELNPEGRRCTKAQDCSRHDINFVCKYWDQVLI